ncbi:MAG TPA: TIGR04086 family membrane protein [Clostridia bacterium]|nr:TIGR04086 family membrane protein [Clostridia bacterium]
MDKKVIIIKGVCMALGISALLLGISIFQALLDPAPVNYLSLYSSLFTASGLLAGGFYVGYKWREKGWLAGGSVGFLYCLVGLIFSLVLIPRSLSLVDLFDALVPGIILAGMAGVCGVNIGRAQKKHLQARSTQIKKKANS